MKWVASAAILALSGTIYRYGIAETFGVIVPCCIVWIVIATAAYVIVRTIAERVASKWGG